MRTSQAFAVRIFWRKDFEQRDSQPLYEMAYVYVNYNATSGGNSDSSFMLRHLSSGLSITPWPDGVASPWRQPGRCGDDPLHCPRSLLLAAFDLPLDRDEAAKLFPVKRDVAGVVDMRTMKQRCCPSEEE